MMQRSLPTRLAGVGALLAPVRIWIVLAVLMVCGAVASNGDFIHPSNLVAVLFVSTPTALAALGETLVILTAGIDLSVASVWVLAAVVGATTASAGAPLPLAVASAIGIGLAIGLLNGLLIAVLKVPPLISTLGMLSVGEGIARVYTGNIPVLSVPKPYMGLGSAYFGPVPLPVLILVTAALALTFVMTRMIMGKQIHAVGFNPVAARYAGLRVGATLVFVYTVSGVLAAIAGVIDSAYVQEAVPNVNMDTLFSIIGGVVVGGTALTGGRGSVINSIGGVLVIEVVQNLMNILGVSPLLAQGVLGSIIVFAVYLNVGFKLRLEWLWSRRGKAALPTMTS